MKMNKKILILLSVLLLLICTVGGTIAYLMTETEPVENTFIPGKVDGEIEEEFENNQKTNICVQNTGNAAAYMRVKLISYWYAPTGDSIIAKDSWFNEFDWSTKADNGWFYADGYFYYPDPIDPEDSTGFLFEGEDGIIVLEKDEEGNRQVLEILADAVQADPNEAVETLWTSVEVNSSGKLVKADDNNQ